MPHKCAATLAGATGNGSAARERYNVLCVRSGFECLGPYCVAGVNAGRMWRRKARNLLRSAFAGCGGSIVSQRGGVHGHHCCAASHRLRKLHRACGRIWLRDARGIAEQEPKLCARLCHGRQRLASRASPSLTQYGRLPGRRQPGPQVAVIWAVRVTANLNACSRTTLFRAASKLFCE
jgi:hypothetical protein